MAWYNRIMDNPFDIEKHREAIDDHKTKRMSDLWKATALKNLSPESCIKFWIEQIGDAELYEERWHQLQENDS